MANDYFHKFLEWIENRYRSSKLFFLIFLFCLILLLGTIFLSIFTIIDFYSTLTNLSNISAFITTIIILLTLLEMQKQRISTYKPQIIIPDNFVLLNFPKESDPFDFEWINNEIDLDDLVIFKKYLPENCNDDPKIKLFNIGMGAAKKITITWSVNYNFFQEFIQYFADLHNFEKIIKYTENASDNAIEFLNKTSNENVGIAWCGGEDNIDFILPININQEPTTINLPFGFSLLFPMLLQYQQCKQKNMIASDETPKYSIYELPPIKMTLTYFDIGDNMYTNYYQVRTSPRGGTLRSISDSCYSNARILFEVKERD